MQRCNNRLAIVAGVSLAALLGIAVPRPAQAQLSTYCVNCSTVVTQLTQYAKEAESMATQLQQYQTQLQQYTNMVTNSVAIPQEAWSTVQSDIMAQSPHRLKNGQLEERSRNISRG